uniref:Uncharacterized protein n=1 Tax=Amphimedon queenslandica TaxID=400682 RepID=A0A1X7T567_AMPQE
MNFVLLISFMSGRKGKKVIQSLFMSRTVPVACKVLTGNPIIIVTGLVWCVSRKRNVRELSRFKVPVKQMNTVLHAHMTVIEDFITKMVKVTYCSHHSNHKPEVCHLRVPDEVKNAVAAKLAEGVTIERILDDIRDSVTGTIEREHLMNRQDVHNIEYKLNLQSIEKHQNDHSSIVAWVTEMQEMECQMRMIMITSIQQ